MIKFVHLYIYDLALNFKQDSNSMPSFHSLSIYRGVNVMLLNKETDITLSHSLLDMYSVLLNNIDLTNKPLTFLLAHTHTFAIYCADIFNSSLPAKLLPKIYF